MGTHRKGFVREPEVKDAGELKALLGDDDLGESADVVGSCEDLGSLSVEGGLRRSGGNIEEDVLWVYNNLQSNVGPGDAPSPGAWTMLGDLRKDGKLRASFWTSIMPKFLKNVGEGGGEDGEIDGSVQIGLIERIRREREKALAE